MIFKLTVGSLVESQVSCLLSGMSVKLDTQHILHTSPLINLIRRALAIFNYSMFIFLLASIFLFKNNFGLPKKKFTRIIKGVVIFFMENMHLKDRNKTAMEEMVKVNNVARQGCVRLESQHSRVQPGLHTETLMKQ